MENLKPGVCGWCGKTYDPVTEDCMRVDCTYSECTETCYHFDCFNVYLKKHLGASDKNRKTGFPCPRNAKKLSSGAQPCPGTITKSHPHIIRKRKKKTKSPDVKPISASQSSPRRPGLVISQHPRKTVAMPAEQPSSISIVRRREPVGLEPVASPSRAKKDAKHDGAKAGPPSITLARKEDAGRSELERMQSLPVLGPAPSPSSSAPAPSNPGPHNGSPASQAPQSHALGHPPSLAPPQQPQLQAGSSPSGSAGWTQYSQPHTQNHAPAQGHTSQASQGNEARPPKSPSPSWAGHPSTNAHPVPTNNANGNPWNNSRHKPTPLSPSHPKSPSSSRPQPPQPPQANHTPTPPSSSWGNQAAPSPSPSPSPNPTSPSAPHAHPHAHPHPPWGNSPAPGSSQHKWNPEIPSSADHRWIQRHAPRPPSRLPDDAMRFGDRRKDESLEYRVLWLSAAENRTDEAMALLDSQAHVLCPVETILLRSSVLANAGLFEPTVPLLSHALPDAPDELILVELLVRLAESESHLQHWRASEMHLHRRSSIRSTMPAPLDPLDQGRQTRVLISDEKAVDLLSVSLIHQGRYGEVISILQIACDSAFPVGNEIAMWRRGLLHALQSRHIHEVERLTHPDFVPCMHRPLYHPAPPPHNGAPPPPSPTPHSPMSSVPSVLHAGHPSMPPSPTTSSVPPMGHPSMPPSPSASSVPPMGHPSMPPSPSTSAASSALALGGGGVGLPELPMALGMSLAGPAFTPLHQPQHQHQHQHQNQHQNQNNAAPSAAGWNTSSATPMSMTPASSAPTTPVSMADTAFGLANNLANGLTQGAQGRLPYSHTEFSPSGVTPSWRLTSSNEAGLSLGSSGVHASNSADVVRERSLSTFPTGVVGTTKSIPPRSPRTTATDSKSTDDSHRWPSHTASFNAEFPPLSAAVSSGNKPDKSGSGDVVSSAGPSSPAPVGGAGAHVRSSLSPSAAPFTAIVTPPQTSPHTTPQHTTSFASTIAPPQSSPHTTTFTSTITPPQSSTTPTATQAPQHIQSLWGSPVIGDCAAEKGEWSVTPHSSPAPLASPHCGVTSSPYCSTSTMAHTAAFGGTGLFSALTPADAAPSSPSPLKAPADLVDLPATARSLFGSPSDRPRSSSATAEQDRDALCSLASAYSTCLSAVPSPASTPTTTATPQGPTTVASPGYHQTPQAHWEGAAKSTDAVGADVQWGIERLHVR